MAATAVNLERREAAAAVNRERREAAALNRERREAASAAAAMDGASVFFRWSDMTVTFSFVIGRPNS